MEINRGENEKYYEAFSPQHHSAVHTLQNVIRRGKEPFQQVQKKSKAGKFWNI